MEVLEKERSNPEIIAITLEILVAVVCDDEETAGGTDELGERLSEIIVRRKGFISSIMSLVECYEFNVRSEVQNAIMSEPMGVSRLVDILHETRERHPEMHLSKELSIVIEDCLFVILNLLRKNSSNQQLFREASLVSPRENVITNTHAAQKSISQSGNVLLTELGVPVEVLTETIIAVAEVIRGNYTNQEYFAARHLLTNVGN
uniref:Uncharacterized protein n=1 Tax=Parascaris equorum TaxID=6256 RepID=A0A914R6R5_PAREQ